jgi:alkanesulfonate monooxygenase SsuD/methylene tetrahydromethanopterin reductase-like flavin-dependent oxidoreductase (luciferase family)
VLVGGVDVLVREAPEWASAPSVWTRIGGNIAVYVQAHESKAVAVYYARYHENPYSPGYYGDALSDVLTREESLVRASAYDRNVHLASPRGGSYAQSLLDETQAEVRAAYGENRILSIADMLDNERAFAIIRAEDISDSDLDTSGEELRARADDEWRDLHDDPNFDANDY